MAELELEIRPRRREGGWVTLSALLRGSDEEYWYRLPEEHEPAVTDSADPYLISCIHQALERGQKLRVHGMVSPTLLRGLEEFMAVWCRWRPERYRPIPVVAELEHEPPPQPEPGLAVMAFSGGLDSCFTFWRHHTGAVGRRRERIAAGVFLQGHDIALGDPEGYERAVERNARLLGDGGAILIPVATNLWQRTVKRNFDGLGAGMLATLVLFQGRYDTGLYAASDRYEDLQMPFASSPLTDPLLSTGRFTIRHDGADALRSEKAALVAQWPRALRDLRVCWEGPQADANCSVCEKCVRSILSFRLAGAPLPQCFSADADDRRIRAMRLRSAGEWDDWQSLRADAFGRGLGGTTWVRVVDRMMRREGRRHRRRQWYEAWRKLRVKWGLRRPEPARRARKHGRRIR